MAQAHRFKAGDQAVEISDAGEVLNHATILELRGKNHALIRVRELDVRRLVRIDQLTPAAA